MRSVFSIRPYAPAPNTKGAVHDAIAVTIATAAIYAEMATWFVKIPDARGVACAFRFPSTARLTAAELIGECCSSYQRAHAA